MKISNVSMAQNCAFKAKTVINAPEFLLEKADKLQLEHMGSKIGNPCDTIEITVSPLYSDEKRPGVLKYNCLQEYNINSKKLKLKGNFCFAVPYITNGKVDKKSSPKTYIGNVLSSLKK